LYKTSLDFSKKFTPFCIFIITQERFFSFFDRKIMTLASLLGLVGISTNRQALVKTRNHSDITVKLEVNRSANGFVE